MARLAACGWRRRMLSLHRWWCCPLPLGKQDFWLAFDYVYRSVWRVGSVVLAVPPFSVCWPFRRWFEWCKHFTTMPRGRIAFVSRICTTRFDQIEWNRLLGIWVLLVSLFAGKLMYGACILDTNGFATGRNVNQIMWRILKWLLRIGNAWRYVVVQVQASYYKVVVQYGLRLCNNHTIFNPGKQLPLKLLSFFVGIETKVIIHDRWFKTTFTDTMI